MDPFSDTHSDSSYDTFESEDTEVAVLHPPEWLGGLGDHAKKEFDHDWLLEMADWPNDATQKEKVELYREMHGNALEDGTYYKEKVRKSGLTFQQYDSLAEAFKGIVKQHPKKPLEESSSEKYKRIKQELEDNKKRRAAKRVRKEVKEGKQGVLTAYFDSAGPDLMDDVWFKQRSSSKRSKKK